MECFRRQGLYLPIIMLLLTVSLVSCQLTQQKQNTLDQQMGSIAPYVRVFDSEGNEVSFGELCAKALDYDAVFLGETHVDEVTHRVEAEFYDRFADATGNKLILAMEMFETDEQKALDEYWSGKITEAEFRKRVTLWGNYDTGYRAMVESARARSLPVIGGNLPSHFGRIIRGKKENFEQMSAEDRAFMPAELYANSEEYWQRFERAVRGHASMMTGGGSEEGRLYSVQSLWDNTMGWSCAEAMKKYPEYKLLHVNGGFHTHSGDGTAHQFSLRSPDSKKLLIQIHPVSRLSGLGEGDSDDSDDASAKPEADYHVYALSRARGLNDGTLAVTTGLELEYYLGLPKKLRSRTDSSAYPLVLVLPQEGVHAKDSFKYWRAAVGEEVILAVLKHPFPQRESNLYDSGRWFWDSSFSSDNGRIHSGLEKICDYLQHYYNVDNDKILVLGEGASATTLVSLSLYRSQLPVQVIAYDPVKYADLKHMSLPNPKMKRYRKGSDWKDLRLFVPTEKLSWWLGELEDYKKSGVHLELDVLEAGRSVLWQAESQLRASLGLKPRKESDSEDPVILQVLPSNEALASHWASLRARKLESRGRVVWTVKPEFLQSSLQSLGNRKVEVQNLAFAWESHKLNIASASNINVLPDLSAANFMKSSEFPLASGSFGGTTLVVLPKEASDEEFAKWQALVDEEIIHSMHRFHRLRVAKLGSTNSVEAALKALEEKGRTTVMIVPATYCAGAIDMLSLKAVVGDFAKRMQISWLPGLGSSWLGAKPADAKNPH